MRLICMLRVQKTKIISAKDMNMTVHVDFYDLHDTHSLNLKEEAF